VEKSGKNSEPTPSPTLFLRKLDSLLSQKRTPRPNPLQREHLRRMSSPSGSCVNNAWTVAWPLSSRTTRRNFYPRRGRPELWLVCVLFIPDVLHSHTGCGVTVFGNPRVSHNLRITHNTTFWCDVPPWLLKLAVRATCVARSLGPSKSTDKIATNMQTLGCRWCRNLVWALRWPSNLPPCLYLPTRSSSDARSAVFALWWPPQHISLISADVEALWHSWC